MTLNALNNVQGHLWWTFPFYVNVICRSASDLRFCYTYRKSSIKPLQGLICFNPSSPGEKLHFSKMITVNQETTSNIPVERYCLGYVLNHHNRHTRCHKLNWGVRKVKRWKHSKIPYSLYILGIPLDYSLICSPGCGDFWHIFTWL